MQKYRIDLGYVGTELSGWQSQPNGNAVQDHVEKALQTVLGEFVRIQGAARTDAGVHAQHQVATFQIQRELDLYRLLPSLNAILSPKIGVRSIVKASENFHAITSATAKVYRYQMWTERSRDPFVEPYVSRIAGPLDIHQMREASNVFVGTHDFSAFCAADSTAKTRVRTLYEVKLMEKGPLVEIWFLGNGFLKHMVRNIVGTLCYVGQKKFNRVQCENILRGLDRNQAGPTAPAAGLCLMKVVYEEPLSLEAFFA